MRVTEVKVKQFSRKITVLNLYVPKPAPTCRMQNCLEYKKSQQGVQGKRVHLPYAEAPGSKHSIGATWLAYLTWGAQVWLCIQQRGHSFSSTCGIRMKTGLASTLQRADITQTLFSDHNGIKLETEK